MRPIPPHSLPLFQNVGTVQTPGDDSSCVCDRCACAEFRVVELLLLILKTFAQCTRSLHNTALASCVILCVAAKRSVASTNGSPTYCQQLPAPRQTRLLPFHRSSRDLWAVPLYHTTRRQI
jgi:hypothetical protein